MAPRNSTRRQQPEPSVQPQGVHINNGSVNDELFLDPMLGSPLSIYIEKDVADRDVIVDSIVVSCVINCGGVFGLNIRGYWTSWKIHLSWRAELASCRNMEA
jgi:hypothetical protein